MRLTDFIFAICLPLSFASPAWAQSGTASFEGAWQVHLACDDTRDRNNGVVKGYVFDFPASVTGGELHAQRGEPGQSASLVLSGTISEDGEARIEAQGNTGKPDYTVGHVRPASVYTYTLRGRFDRTHGHADRQELRRCSAEFDRAAGQTKTN